MTHRNQQRNSAREMPRRGKNFTVTIDDGLNVISLHADADERLLDVLRRSGKPIEAPCGGTGSCGKCEVEIDSLGAVLACQFAVHRDIHVKMPGFRHHAILEQQSHLARSFENDSDVEVVMRRGKKIVSYMGRTIATSRATDGRVEKYGLAIDIGSTTVVVFLYDLTTYELVDVAPFLNPQIAYGGDVISRITYCIEEKDGLAEMQRILIKRINVAIADLCRKNDISPRVIYKMTVVGNNIMQHILLGVDPRSIAFAPYTPVFVDEQQTTADALQLDIHPRAPVKILPSIAGYVGADIVAGLATTDLLEHDGYTLYLDIGTNGEIVLGNRDRIFCCAAAAGPAFEGANIACGVGAVDGAISAYEEDECATIGGGPAIGVCGSGLIDIIAALLDKGYIDSTGYMEKEFLIVPQQESASQRDIVLTPHDVREVQLAKSAIYAGIITLMKAADVSFDQIERLYLAGGFGNYIRAASAIRIGLLPQELAGRIMPIGNSAGAGACFALKSAVFAKEIERIVAKSEYIELSMREDFTELYAASMIFEGKGER